MSRLGDARQRALQALRANPALRHLASRVAFSLMTRA
jgi:hypothetical protein